MIKYITENTMVPLGVAIAVIGGGSLWLSSVQAKLSVYDEHFQRIEERQERVRQGNDEARKNVQEIRDAVFEMKGEIKELLKRSDRR